MDLKGQQEIYPCLALAYFHSIPQGLLSFKREFLFRHNSTIGLIVICNTDFGLKKAGSTHKQRLPVLISAVS